MYSTYFTKIIYLYTYVYMYVRVITKKLSLTASVFLEGFQVHAALVRVCMEVHSDRDGYHLRREQCFFFLIHVGA